MDNTTDLQAIYDETAADLSESAADSVTEETVTEEVAETTEDGAAVDTPEDAADTEETTDETEVSDETEESESTDSPSDESFQDLLEDIPSDETLNSKLTRTPQPVKDLAFELRNGWQAEKAITASIGGEEGAKVLAPIYKAINTPVENFTPENAAEAISSLVMSNGAVAAKILEEGAQNLLFNTEDGPLWEDARKIGDRVAMKRFGVDSATIDKMVLLSKEGWFDVNADFETLKATGADSNVFQALQAENKAKDDEIKRLSELVENPHLIRTETKQAQNAVTEMETDLLTRIEEGIKPFQQRGRWDGAPRLTQTTLKAVMAEIKDSPEYKDALALVRQYGSFKQSDGTLPFPLQGKVLTLINKAKGRFGEELAGINSELRNRAQAPTNVQKEIKKETKPKAAPVAAIPSHFGGAVELDPELAKIYREADAARAA